MVGYWLFAGKVNDADWTCDRMKTFSPENQVEERRENRDQVMRSLFIFEAILAKNL